jgi:hypothetical protein
VIVFYLLECNNKSAFARLEVWMNKKQQELLAYMQSEGHDAHLPTNWTTLWNTLPEDAASSGALEPSPPLRLDGWNEPHMIKVTHLRQHPILAYERGVRDDLDLVLREQSVAAWLIDIDD